MNQIETKLKWITPPLLLQSQPNSHHHTRTITSHYTTEPTFGTRPRTLIRVRVLEWESKELGNERKELTKNNLDADEEHEMKLRGSGEFLARKNADMADSRPMGSPAAAVRRKGRERKWTMGR
ncbi:hypothetical protein Droror1_Dr00012243 [Drosera rotundifolia]